MVFLENLFIPIIPFVGNLRRNDLLLGFPEISRIRILLRSYARSFTLDGNSLPTLPFRYCILPVWPIPGAVSVPHFLRHSLSRCIPRSWAYASLSPHTSSRGMPRIPVIYSHFPPRVFGHPHMAPGIHLAFGHLLLVFVLASDCRRHTCVRMAPFPS